MRNKILLLAIRKIIIIMILMACKWHYAREFQSFFFSFSSLYVFFLGARLNTTNTTGLDEYVDILQVQQLLLDSSATPSTSGATSSSAASAAATAKHRPRVNIQKATDYTAASVAGTACTTATASMAQVQGEIIQMNQNATSIKKRRHISENIVINSLLLCTLWTNSMRPSELPNQARTQYENNHSDKSV